MKFSAMTIGTISMVLLGAFIVAEASGYNSQNAYPRHHKNEQQGYGSYGSESGSYGSNSNSYIPAPTSSYRNSRYGPYHSYAVKPALYGGYNLYTYRGYARHPVYKPLRPMKSYKKSNNHYQLKPVKALALAPAYPTGYNSYAPRAPRYQPAAPAYNHRMPNYGAPSYHAPSYSMPSYKPPSYGSSSYGSPSSYKSYRTPSYSPPNYKSSSYSHPAAYKQSEKRYRHQPTRSHSAPYSSASSGY